MLLLADFLHHSSRQPHNLYWVWLISYQSSSWWCPGVDTSSWRIQCEVHPHGHWQLCKHPFLRHLSKDGVSLVIPPTDPYPTYWVYGIGDQPKRHHLAVGHTKGGQLTSHTHPGQLMSLSLVMLLLGERLWILSGVWHLLTTWSSNFPH